MLSPAWSTTRREDPLCRRAPMTLPEVDGPGAGGHVRDAARGHRDAAARRLRRAGRCAADPPAPPRSRPRITTSTRPSGRVRLPCSVPVSAAENGELRQGDGCAVEPTARATAPRRRASSERGRAGARGPAVRAGPGLVPDEERERHDQRRERRARERAPAARPASARSRARRPRARPPRRTQTPTHAHPAEPRVAAGPERVDERDRPRRVREPVDVAPDAVADPRAEQARRDEREQQVERDRAEPEPDRPVRRDERDDRVLERRSARSRRRPSSRRGRRRSATASSVRLRWRPATTKRGQRVAAPAHGREHAEGDRGGQEQQRDDARAARQVPERSSRSRRPRAIMPPRPRLGPAGDGRRPAPSCRTTPRRQPPRRRASRAAASPRTIAAVLATFASTHVAAATVTVRQGVTAGRPVRGSTMW